MIEMDFITNSNNNTYTPTITAQNKDLFVDVDILPPWHTHTRELTSALRANTVIPIKLYKETQSIKINSIVVLIDGKLRWFEVMKELVWDGVVINIPAEISGQEWPLHFYNAVFSYKNNTVLLSGFTKIADNSYPILGFTLDITK